jgi:hypothetical protein
MSILNKLVKNKFVYIVLIVCAILFLTIFIKLIDGNDDGRLYPNRQSLCIDFAESYLKTVQKTDDIKDFGGEKWQAAVAVESDFYNMCLLDLKKDNLKNYKTTNIERFLEHN